jgi:hypothetical protein
VNFETTVLKRDGAKMVWAVCANFLGEEDNVRLVYRAKVGVERVKGLKSGKMVIFYQIPVMLVEGRTKAIRPRARVVIHGEERLPNFF